MAAPPPPPKGLSLYDNLQDPNDPSPCTTLSSAPVIYNHPEATTNEPAPKKRNPALQFQPIRRPQVKPAKPKATFPKTVSKPTVPPTAATSQPPPQKSSLADWAVTEEDEWMYGVGEKRQRGGRKKKKSRYQDQFETNWDELYDPTRPTNVEEFLKSDEKVEEIKEWKALLCRHRRRRDQSVISDDENEDTHSIHTVQFAPPPLYSFAPPPKPPPPVAPPDDESADNAYAEENEPYSPPPSLGTGDVDTNDNDSNPQPRSSRPGQAGFAQRLMSKYGWTKGTALGASESGILDPLRVQVQKRRKKADADGGGWAEPASKGKIVGGKRKDEGGGKFGSMSEVIILQNMLENMPDLQAEIADGLGQEIGEECGEKYGRVERLYIHQENRQVFIKFTNQVSALRAVNELDGRVFNGNKIMPKFYDTEKFEKGIYEDAH